MKTCNTFNRYCYSILDILEMKIMTGKYSEFPNPNPAASTTAQNGDGRKVVNGVIQHFSPAVDKTKHYFEFEQAYNRALPRNADASESEKRLSAYEEGLDAYAKLIAEWEARCEELKLPPQTPFDVLFNANETGPGVVLPSPVFPSIPFEEPAPQPPTQITRDHAYSLSLRWFEHEITGHADHIAVVGGNDRIEVRPDVYQFYGESNLSPENIIQATLDCQQIWKRPPHPRGSDDFNLRAAVIAELLDVAIIGYEIPTDGELAHKAEHLRAEYRPLVQRALAARAIIAIEAELVKPLYTSSALRDQLRTLNQELSQKPDSFFEEFDPKDLKEYFGTSSPLPSNDDWTYLNRVALTILPDKTEPQTFVLGDQEFTRYRVRLPNGQIKTAAFDAPVAIGETIDCHTGGKIDNGSDFTASKGSRDPTLRKQFNPGPRHHRPQQTYQPDGAHIGIAALG